MRGLRGFLFENRSASQTVAKNAAWLTISQVGARLIRAGFMVYLARLVGAEGYGAISYALSLAALVSTVTDLGISGVITREGSRHRDGQLRYLATGAAAKGGLVLVAAAALAAWGLLGAPSAALMPLVIAIVAFDGVRDLVSALFRAQERMELEAYVQLATNGAIAVLALVAALALGSPAWILGGYAAGCFVGALAALWPLRGSLRSLHGRFDRSLVRSLVRSSWTFGIVGLVGGVMLNTDAIMLALFRPAAEVGYYAAAQRVVALAYVLPLPVASAIFPLVARLADDRARFKEVVEGASRFLLVIGTGGAIALLAGSGAVISLLYGKEYEPAGLSLAIMSLTLVPSFLVASLGNALFALRKERALVGYAVVAVIANVGANLLLIPRFGGPGSALATLLAQVALLGYLAVVLRRAAGVSVLRGIPELAVGTLAGMIVAIAVIFLGVNGIIAGIAGGCAFLFALYLIKDETTLLALRKARAIRSEGR